MRRSITSQVPRKIWRMSADAPLGEIVEIDPAREVSVVARADPPALDIDEWPTTDWQASSYDLLTGCEVKDYTARIPDRVFNALFKD